MDKPVLVLDLSLRPLFFLLEVAEKNFEEL